jgi:hypothetical protein
MVTVFKSMITNQARNSQSFERSRFTLFVSVFGIVQDVALHVQLAGSAWG